MVHPGHGPHFAHPKRSNFASPHFLYRSEAPEEHKNGRGRLGRSERIVFGRLRFAVLLIPTLLRPVAFSRDERLIFLFFSSACLGSSPIPLISRGEILSQSAPSPRTDERFSAIFSFYASPVRPDEDYAYAYVCARVRLTVGHPRASFDWRRLLMLAGPIMDRSGRITQFTYKEEEESSHRRLQSRPSPVLFSREYIGVCFLPDERRNERNDGGAAVKREGQKRLGETRYVFRKMSTRLGRPVTIYAKIDGNPKRNGGLPLILAVFSFSPRASPSRYIQY